MDARGPRPTRPNGVHHLAISTADIKTQIEFFSEVLGCELVALYWMHAGTMQHVAFNVDSYDELIATRDRIRSHGINVMGPIHHGMCDSIYFGGPEGLTLEVATSLEAIDGDHWIDPDVATLAGISPQELQRYRGPAQFRRPATPLPNPPIDWSKPHMTYPKAVYEQLMAMPDADVAARFSEPNPPV
jgi:hypothetical protein